MRPRRRVLPTIAYPTCVYVATAVLPLDYGAPGQPFYGATVTPTTSLSAASTRTSVLVILFVWRGPARRFQHTRVRCMGEATTGWHPVCSSRDAIVTACRHVAAMEREEGGA